MEIERLHNAIGEKHKDLELFADKHVEMEKSHSAHIERVRNLEKSENERRLASEKTIYEASIKSLQGRIAELEGNLTTARQEKERFLGQISEYNRLLDETKITISSLEIEHQKRLGSLEIEIQSKLRIDHVFEI